MPDPLQTPDAAPPTSLRLLHPLLGILLLTPLPLLLLVGSLEILARLSGEKPLDLSQSLSATIPDNHTGWRLRPNVTEGPEYVHTNALGLHHPREVTLAKPPQTTRVAIVGSSVVYGPGMNFPDTISEAAQAELAKAGHTQTEVLNFGTHGFNLSNILSYVQHYIVQFRPDALVLVVDLQVAFPIFPIVQQTQENIGAIKKLSWREALLKRAASYSVIFKWIDQPQTFRVWLQQQRHLSLDQPPRLPAPTITTAAPPEVPTPEAPPPAEAAPAETPAPSAAEDGLAQYRQERERLLRAHLESLVAFCRNMQIPLYLVSPYGPYFASTEEEVMGYSLHMLAPADVHYGSRKKSLAAEVEFVTATLRDIATHPDVYLIDMLEASRTSTMANNPDFSGDAIHLSAAGNRHLGQIIAQELLRTGKLPPPR